MENSQDVNELIRQTEEVLNESEGTLKSIEKKIDKNTDDISKYYDRINDKLFQLNTVLLGMSSIFTYFKLVNYPKWLIFICLFNLGKLIQTEYFNMESRRNWANLELEKGQYLSNKSTRTSLYVILLTSIYLIIVLFYVFFK